MFYEDGSEGPRGDCFVVEWWVTEPVPKMLIAIRTINQTSSRLFSSMAPFKNFVNGNIRIFYKSKSPPLNFFMGQLQPSWSCGISLSLTREKIKDSSVTSPLDVPCSSACLLSRFCVCDEAIRLRGQGSWRGPEPLQLLCCPSWLPPALDSWRVRDPGYHPAIFSPPQKVWS